jgi:ABC-2 type transport system ATP-binding protein
MLPGEIFGLLGPNGAGKTSLISVVTTLEQATAGSVEVFGHSVLTESRVAKSMLGVVPQEIINNGFFKVEEVMHFNSGYQGVGKNHQRIEYLLNKLGLWEHRRKGVKQLSGGMKRRLLIAKALVHSPRLLLLDEPTAGVDMELRNNLWQFVRELKSEGVSILLTTHYIEEAEQLCDRIGILQNGELKRLGPTKDLIQEFTGRTVVLSLREGLPPIESPYLQQQTVDKLFFRIPANMGVGDLISDLHLDWHSVTDVHIEEGNLEEALQKVLGGY